MKRGKISSAELSDEFSVSRNTIINDLSLLSGLYPIKALSGRNGGYCYAGERKLQLSRKEAYIVLRTLKFNDSDDIELRALINKLEKFCKLK